MSKVPARFKRVAAAFDEVARCASSGSEHSPAESSGFLSDLVNSFLERREHVAEDGDSFDQEIVGDKMGSENNCSAPHEMCKDGMQSLLAGFGKYDPAKTKIHAAVEEALREVRNCSSVDYKRLLMAQLRHRGFDAGLCKSKWEKTKHSLPGYHEYIDVILEGTRYIVEVSLANEFEIARPSGFYSELLDHLPLIFVGKRDELKKIVRVMCESMKKCMKSTGMKVPPWRRLGYMNAKWFNSYNRTTNEVASQRASCFDEGLERNRLVGFVTGPAVSYLCRESIAAKGGVKVGNLAAALQDDAFTIL